MGSYTHTKNFYYVFITLILQTYEVFWCCSLWTWRFNACVFRDALSSYHCCNVWLFELLSLSGFVSVFYILIILCLYCVILSFPWCLFSPVFWSLCFVFCLFYTSVATVVLFSVLPIHFPFTCLQLLSPAPPHHIWTSFLSCVQAVPHCYLVIPLCLYYLNPSVSVMVASLSDPVPSPFFLPLVLASSACCLCDILFFCFLLFLTSACILFTMILTDHLVSDFWLFCLTWSALFIKTCYFYILSLCMVFLSRILTVSFLSALTSLALLLWPL